MNVDHKDGTSHEMAGGRKAAKKARVAPTAAEQDLLDLRTASHAYESLVRNMVWSFQTKGLTVRVAGRKGRQPQAIGGEVPTLTAASEKALFILEFATAAMMKNAHLLARLKAFSEVEGARRWLVVTTDDWAHARELVAELDIDWQVIVGDR